MVVPRGISSWAPSEVSATRALLLGLVAGGLVLGVSPCSWT